MSNVKIPELNITITEYKVLERADGRLANTPYDTYSPATAFEVVKAHWIEGEGGDPMEVLVENYPIVNLYLAADDRDEWMQARYNQGVKR